MPVFVFDTDAEHVTVFVPTPVSRDPELHAFPTGSSSVNGVFAVHVIDSNRSVDSASAPTNAYPVSGAPPGPVTVIPSSVAVVVVSDFVWFSAGRPETPV